MNTSIFRTFLTIVCTCVLAGPAGAQSLEEARIAFAEGRFTEAADLTQVLDRVRSVRVGHAPVSRLSLVGTAICHQHADACTLLHLRGVPRELQTPD